MTLRDKIAEAVREAIDSVHDMDVTFDDYARASADAVLDVIRADIADLHDAAWAHTEAFCVIEDSGQAGARDRLEAALSAFSIDQ